MNNDDFLEDAIQIFLKRAVLDVYDSSNKSMINLLANEPSGRAKQPLEESLHVWYQTLNEKGEIQN